MLAIPIVLLAACKPQQKIPNYLQSVSDTTRLPDPKFTEIRIQPNDLLNIQVFSSSTKREISDAPYNLPATGPEGTNSGFLVDLRGNIEYPMLGELHVEGLTRLELADLIKHKINETDSVLTNPTVIVRFANLRITVLGEVGRQGVIQFPGERVSILEAIGLAGGVTEFGLKQSVKVVREVDGRRQVGVVDLSSDSLFSSPYFNLLQNDLVLVDPTPRKAKKAEQEVFFRQAGFIISIVTAMAVVIRLFQ